jgi:hypothetical protein
LIYLTIFFFNYINCDDWKYGLNNNYIKNDITKYGCQIKFPDKCPYKIFKYVHDINKTRKIKCQNYKKNGINILLDKSNSPYLKN